MSKPQRLSVSLDFERCRFILYVISRINMAGVLCPYFVAHIKTDDNIIFQVGYSLNKVLFFIGSKIFYS